MEFNSFGIQEEIVNRHLLIAEIRFYELAGLIHATEFVNNFFVIDSLKLWQIVNKKNKH